LSEHDALGRLLADAGYALQDGRLLAHDGALEKLGAERAQDSQRHLRPNPLYAQQYLEQLQVVLALEAEERQVTFTHLQMGVKANDTTDPADVFQDGARHEDAHAYPADGHDQAAGFDLLHGSAKTGNHFE
jgi:hypothetical protein